MRKLLVLVILLVTTLVISACGQEETVTEIRDEEKGFYISLGKPDKNIAFTLVSGELPGCQSEWITRQVYNVSIYDKSADEKIIGQYPGEVTLRVGFRDGEENSTVYLYDDECQILKWYDAAQKENVENDKEFPSYKGYIQVVDGEFPDANVGIGPVWNPIGPAPIDFTDDSIGFFIAIEQPTGDDELLLDIGALPPCQPESVTRPVFNAAIYYASNLKKFGNVYPGTVTLKVGYFSGEEDYNVYLYEDDCEIIKTYLNGIDFSLIPDVFGSFEGNFEITDNEFPDPNVGIGP